MPSPFLEEWGTSCTCRVLLWSRCSKCCRSWLNRGRAYRRSFETVSPFCRNLCFQTFIWSYCGNCRSAPIRWTDLLIWVSWCNRVHLVLFKLRDLFLIWIWWVLEGNRYIVLKGEQRFFEKNLLRHPFSFGRESKCVPLVLIRLQLLMKDLCLKDNGE